MAGWSLVDTHPTQGRIFQRPLGVLELCFFWDGLVNGTADSSHYYQLRLSNGPQDAHLFSEANIKEAWLSTKRRFPLASAIVRGADMATLRLADSSTRFVPEPHFVVREHDLVVLRPHEIVFRSVSCAEDAQNQAAAILHGPRRLSEDLLLQLHVFHETTSERADVLHIILLVPHCLSDGTATRTFVRCLLDTLARGGMAVPAQIPLEERLAMAIPLADLHPAHVRSLSPARRRWRKVVGIIIFQSRVAKMQGGQTLPCHFTRSTSYIAARPNLVSTSLTLTQTAAVIANCHLHGVTFGNAYLALAQVAMTRVLYRRYLLGEISENEWAYRKKQPHINGGPLNLRRYLDQAWYEGGGGGEFVLSMSLYIYKLPFMTLGEPAERCRGVSSDTAPPFSNLLTFDRFLHRAKLVKKQATAFFSHPLFLEIVHATHLFHVQYTQHRAMQWMQRAATAASHETHKDTDEDETLATEIPTVWAHGGSSLGNVDLMFPFEYPLPPSHPLSPYSPVPRPPVKAGYATPPSSPSVAEADTTPKILVEDTRTHLYTRPAELYLGAATSRGQMNIFVHYDGNVFEEGVVREWLDEVRGAVLWYLGPAQ